MENPTGTSLGLFFVFEHQNCFHNVLVNGQFATETEKKDPVFFCEMLNSIVSVMFQILQPILFALYDHKAKLLNKTAILSHLQSFAVAFASPFASRFIKLVGSILVFQSRS